MLSGGGVPGRNQKGERLLLFLGVIDILQNYRLMKKLEHAVKSIVHDGVCLSELSSHIEYLHCSSFLEVIKFYVCFVQTCMAFSDLHFLYN